MFFLLFRKELLEQLLSLRFAMACIICLVVVLSSTWVLTKEYKESLADYRTNVVLHKNEIEESNDLVGDGIKIDKPLNPMQIFFKGLDQELTATAKVNAQSEPQFEASYEGNPVGLLFPPIDLLFFIGIVMSLLAIAFSYDAVAGEKELGTLKLLMSYSVPRDLVLLAKWIGGYLALVAPFLVAVLCGLVVLVLSPTVELRSQDWGALGLIMFCALLYLAAIYSLGIFVSTHTQLASTSITVLLMVWVLVVLVVPNTAPYLAAQLHPVRDFVLIDKEKYQIEQEEEQRFHEAWREWREKKPNSPNNVRRSTWSALRRDQYLRLSDHHDKINDQFSKQLDGQIRLGQYLSRISPLSSFAYAASDLAGTGIQDRNRFLDLLPEYRREITTFGYQTYIDANLNQTEPNIEGYPKFTFAESPLSDRIAWVDILFLGMWNILFFMGAYLSFLRYDVK